MEFQLEQQSRWENDFSPHLNMLRAEIMFCYEYFILNVGDSIIIIIYTLKIMETEQDYYEL